MTDDRKLKNAHSVYNTLCEMLDAKTLRYEKHPEDLVVTFVVKGDDMPMQFIVKVDEERELVRVMSPIPVTFEGDRCVDAAIATCQVNYRMADGSFDFDFRKGRILFRVTSSYADSLISKELLEYMIGLACYMVDEYNDKFLMLSKGMISVDEFLKKN